MVGIPQRPLMEVAKNDYGDVGWDINGRPESVIVKGELVAHFVQV